MKIAKGIKTVKKTDTYTVFNDYGKLVNHVSLYVITELEKLSDDGKNAEGFKISFRSYSETFENGGFETTLWVRGTSINNAEMFLGSISEAKTTCSLMKAELISYKTNNKKK